MKKLTFLISAIMMISTFVIAQSKPDTTIKYTLTEAQVLHISQLLSYADGVANNSDKVTTRDYNEFHRQIFQVDSLLRVQYLRWHPQKKDAKKP